MAMKNTAAAGPRSDLKALMFIYVSTSFVNGNINLMSVCVFVSGADDSVAADEFFKPVS